MFQRRLTPDDYIVCRTCGRCKLKEEFYKDRFHRTGRKTKCIQCILKMVVILFKPEFADLVESGKKKQTIRPVRKKTIKIGDAVSLRKWSGQPYRSKQVLLHESFITNVRPIKIAYSTTGHRSAQLWIGGEGFLDGARNHQFVVADGFTHLKDFMAFFEKNHSLPFRGIVINWY